MLAFGKSRILTGDRRSYSPVVLPTRSERAQTNHSPPLCVSAPLRGGWPGGLCVLRGSMAAGWALKDLPPAGSWRSGRAGRSAFICVICGSVFGRQAQCPLCLCGFSGRRISLAARRHPPWGQANGEGPPRGIGIGDCVSTELLEQGVGEHQRQHRFDDDGCRSDRRDI